MTKEEIIGMLANSRSHAAKLRALPASDLRLFIEAHTDPSNHDVFKPGDFVYISDTGTKGIITGSEIVPGWRDDKRKVFVRVNRSLQIHTTTDNIIRYQG